MTIRQALSRGDETDLLLSHVLHQPKEFLFLHSDKILSRAQQARFRQLLRRRHKGEPMAYILGYKYFYGLKFKVTKDVLIPRPETEWLVDRALTAIKNRKYPLRLIDVGTGSGCIAISLAKQRTGKKALIHASDISAKALAIARHNARQHHAKISFFRSDLLTRTKQKFDLLVANLPYVPPQDYTKLKTGLKYEPREALIGTPDLYKKLFAQLDDHLNFGALVLLEIDPSTKGLFANMLSKNPHVGGLKFIKDYHGLWRFVEFVWRPAKFQ